MSELSEIEKIISSRLAELKKSVPVWASIVVTEDGLPIAYDLAEHTDLTTISAIISSVVSIAERGVQELVPDQPLNQVILKIGDDPTGQTIIMEKIWENVIIFVIFPTVSNLGLVLLELENAIRDIIEVIKSNVDVKLHPETVL